MLLNFLILILILNLLFLILVFFRTYLIIKINGNSMLPTLQDGKYYIAQKINFEIEVGNIYIIKTPHGSHAIKRLHVIVDDKYYFLGDNADESFDSRNYGYIERENIIAMLNIGGENK